MTKKGILGMFAFGGCSHQFSWPRRSATDQYYQVCVLCGDEYRYDWQSMRRLGRKAPELAATAGSTEPQARWTPRARRIRLTGPVRYREVGSDIWCDGELKNISQSGLLFAGTSPLRERAKVELELEMPAEICGSAGRRVRCDAQIVRTGIGARGDLAAAQIFGYVFVNRPHLLEIVPRLRKCTGNSR